MILKCLIAYGRWLWGVSPAFYQIQSPIKEPDAILICFGIFLDVIAVGGIVGFLASIWLSKHEKDSE